MLVLTRKVNEEIVIDVDGELVTVKIAGINGKRVSIGITCDRRFNIRRSELSEGNHDVKK